MGQGGLSLNAFGSRRSMNALFGSRLSPQTVIFVLHPPDKGEKKQKKRPN
jgi:hypothetical protein